MEKPTQLKLMHVQCYSQLKFIVNGTTDKILSYGYFTEPDGSTWILNIAARLTFKLHEVKPILRPLSDLNVVINWPDGKYAMTYKNITTQRQISAEGYKTIQSYIKRHFDVFGLIDVGLAVDINTLNK